MVTSPRRLKKVLYRAHRSEHWEEKDLKGPVQTLARRLKATRDALFLRHFGNVPANCNEALGSSRRLSPEQWGMPPHHQAQPAPGGGLF